MGSEVFAFAGFEIIDIKIVIDIGIDVSAEKFVEAARENNADIIGLSALLTTTMTQMPVVIEFCKYSVAG